MIIPKPTHRMKTVVKRIEQCLDKEQNCIGCEYVNDIECKQKLMTDGLYYLKMTLEKSEGKK